MFILCLLISHTGQSAYTLLPSVASSTFLSCSTRRNLRTFPPVSTKSKLYILTNESTMFDTNSKTAQLKNNNISITNKVGKPPSSFINRVEKIQEKLETVKRILKYEKFTTAVMSNNTETLWKNIEN